MDLVFPGGSVVPWKVATRMESRREFVTLPCRANGFLVTDLPAHRLDFLQRYLAWFKKYRGDPV
jgi:hypothetical protein